VRVFVIHSDGRLEYERGEREKSMQRVGEQLETLQARMAGEELKVYEKIWAAVGMSLSRNHGSRYYDWELKDRQQASLPWKWRFRLSP
jgi:hypothetical protein